MEPSVRFPFVTGSCDLKNYVGSCRNRSSVSHFPPNQNLDSHSRDEGRPVPSFVASWCSAGPSLGRERHSGLGKKAFLSNYSGNLSHVGHNLSLIR